MKEASSQTQPVELRPNLDMPASASMMPLFIIICLLLIADQGNILHYALQYVTRTPHGAFVFHLCDPFWKCYVNNIENKLQSVWLLAKQARGEH